MALSDPGSLADISIALAGAGSAPTTTLDPATGALQIEQPDGGVVIQFNPPRPSAEPDTDDAFDANLADQIEDGERNRIVAELLEGIEADDRSREEWLRTRALGIEMLGFRLEEARKGGFDSAAPLEGMSVVRHTLLPEACIRFQANASAELLPAGGPVKVKVTAPPKPPNADEGNQGGPAAPPQAPPLPIPDEDADSDEDEIASILHKLQTGNPPPPAPGESEDELAEALEADFNHYLTVTDKGYRADTVRMLFSVGFGGCAFKKVYNCPIKQRPISRSVDAKDLIVSNDANDLDDAGRITHRVTMRKALMRRMQLCGAYRDVPLGQPNPEPNPVDEAEARAQGRRDKPDRPEDFPYEVLECYCELDIRGYEHKDSDGQPTGLPLPWKVSIERTSRQLLELRRNWREDDETYTARRFFVKYSFVRALGFYDIGLLHILGNADRALTAAWREMLDAGMFASFPGFLYAKTSGRQMTNELRVPPGGGRPIDTGGVPIQNAVMPLPYRDPGPGMVALIQHIEQVAQRIGGTAELPISEGRQEAPVGTTLALIEQATKVIAAVHVGLHASQAEEFQLLKDRFRDDPGAFWRFNPRTTAPWREQQFLRALDDCDIVPAADPNTPSHMHRIMVAVAVKQLQAANPTLYDPKAVDRRILSMIRLSNPDELFAQQPPPAMPQAPPIDPARMAEVQIKGQQQQQEHQARLAELQQDAQNQERERQAKAQMAVVESADRAADRQAHTQLELLKIQEQRERAQQQPQQPQQPPQQLPPGPTIGIT